MHTDIPETSIFLKTGRVVGHDLKNWGYLES